MEILILRADTKNSFLALCFAINALEDPSQYAHVFTKAGPYKLTSVVFAEPVDAINLR